MFRSGYPGDSYGRDCPTAFSVLVLLAFLWEPPESHAQAAVDPSAGLSRTPSGRMFEANPQLGGRGANVYRPMSPLVGGNMYASGIAARGMSLRSYSPIGDPTAFRGYLGSGALHGFRRDSVGLDSSPLGSTALIQPYYDPYTTAPTVGFLQGLSGLGPDRTTTPIGGPMDLRLQMRQEQRVTLGQQTVRLPPAPATPLESTWPQATSWATASSIFGPDAAPRLLLPTEPERPWARPRSDEDLERDPLRAAAARQQQRLDLKQALGIPLETELRSDRYPRLGPPPSVDVTSTAKPGLILPERPSEPLHPKPPVPRIADASVLPGFDAFTDMQLALALRSEPNAAWFQEMRRAVQEQPDLALQVDKQALESVADFVQKVLNAPLRTLAGEGSSALNDQLLRAEALMEIGHYVEAADRYEAARQLAPNNPLPLLGKGHALLASGNYRSAALAILAAFELADRIPGMAAALFKRLDLTTLMGGAEVVDIRRADIMRQLQQRENAELRFLLGYLEYHSGDRERGLENLRRAAENPRAPTLIGRYPGLLEATPGLPGLAQPSEAEGGPSPRD